MDAEDRFGEAAVLFLTTPPASLTINENNTESILAFLVSVIRFSHSFQSFCSDALPLITLRWVLSYWTPGISTWERFIWKTIGVCPMVECW